MTLSHPQAPVQVATVEEAFAALRQHGLRVSSARRLVVEALFAAEGPVSAERIASGIDGRIPRCDLTSVYRNLETFEEIGLVRHVHLGHGPGLYALNTAGEREYLVCEVCSRVKAVESADLDGVRLEIRQAFGFEARFGHFPIVGLCAACADDSSHEVTP